MVKLSLTSFGQRGKLSHYFKIKDNVKNLSCIMYQGICSCGNNYLGETIRNAVTRIDEHKQPNGVF